MNGDTYSSRGESGRPRDHYRDERRERGGERGERRRSRSPHYNSRGSRREAEADSYSSSRDYRAREREDRYSSRRDDRDYDRERGDRRRREHDERPARRERDRDLFEERPRRERGERGGERGERDRGARDRKRSPSPARKREPTPDLTDIQSVLTRKRRLTQWDIKPPGYENVTAEQAKLSGMFPLPGAPRQQPMDPSRLQAFMNQPGGGSADTSALKPSNSRQAKRLFVYNLPQNVNGDGLASFFNLQLNGLNVIQGIDPCISAQISDDRSYALLEFKSPNDATVALAFDGITMEEHANAGNGAEDGAPKGLEVRRPKDYIVPNTADQELEEGMLLKDVPDSPNKICVSNIPQYIPEEPVTMLLKSFGELKAFVLVKDSSTEESRGIAFCEYVDPAITTIAVQGLNGMELGDRHLKVVRASIGMTQAVGLDMGVNAMSMFAKTTSQDLEVSRVLQLLNMVTSEELMDSEDYEEICDDVREECSKYGQVLELKIPRPTGGSRQSPGVGKIFVKFDTIESTTAALKALAGRKFSDRTVVTTYFSEENFDVNAW
ncbi:hypothetical protein BJX66DRAFT_315843 [Aspergillus keveii]|uniref:Splicing factor U2AF subunit n=1 Tax=Aspergillus keveii TaxID=714993 RepID=A0ABR4FPM2_9EURO